MTTSTNTGYGVTDGVVLTHFNWGQQVANGHVYQTFKTIPNQSYLLRFDMGAVAYQNNDEQQMLVTVKSPNSTLLSQSVSIFAQGTGHWYQPESFVFVADSDTATLDFQDTSPTTINIDMLLDNIRITLQDAPLIVSQPQSTAVQEGGTAMFSVTASGQQPLSYQWRFKGNDIPAANSSSYTINNVQAGDAGDYDVVVSNAVDMVTSNAATLGVVPPGTPSNGSFEYGFAVWGTSGNQFIVSTPDYPVSDGSKAVAFNAGQTTPNAVLMQTFATTPMTTYTLTFDLGVTSYQTTAEQRMQVTVQGSNGNVLPPQTISIFAQGTGSRYESKSYTFVADSDSTTIIFQDISPATINLDMLLDNVKIRAQDAPAISSQPQSVAVLEGDNATFNVTATGQQPLSYQWRLNGMDIPAANSSSYTINNVQAGDAGDYDVVVSNALDMVTSATATLSVVPPGTPANGSFEYGYAVWAASGNQEVVSTPDYPVSDGSKAVAFNAGQTTPNAVLMQTFATTPMATYTLTFDLGVTSYQTTAEQRMQVTVEDGHTPADVRLAQTTSIFAQGTGSHYETKSFTFTAESDSTTLIFQDVSPATINLDMLLDKVAIAAENAPAISSQPQSVAVLEGDNATFSVTATGQQPLSYQWRLNGMDIPAANSSSYTINNVQAGDAGDYDVVVSNAVDMVTSNAATLSVVPPGTPANGSFEYGYAVWAASGNQEVVSTPDYPVSDGSKAVAFNAGQTTPNAVLMQTFATTPMATYTLTFDLGVTSYQTTAEQRMQVTVEDGHTPADVRLAQTTSIFAQGTGSHYETKSFTFTAESDSTTLIFQDVSPATINLDMLLDKVAIAAENAPAISSQPQSVAVLEGDNATFSVTATGQQPLSYQWRLNGMDIPAANSSSYTINNVQAGDAGDYDVVVSNAVDMVTSNTATLSVVPPGTPANGSFEYGYAVWAASGNQEVVSTPDYPVSDGSKAVAFNAGQTTPNAVLMQTFATTPMATYTLTFDLGVTSYQTTAEQRMQVTVEDGHTPADVRLAQTTSIFAQGTGSHYETKSFTFTAESDSTTLIFQDVSPATINLDMLLDKVLVTPEGP